ncbi:MAG: restriction endonuclease [Planctomycetia bacterium]|nr:restriction endonuclease [Planctomycetia bacterium]
MSEIPKAVRQKLVTALQSLPYREREIFKLVTGLGDGYWYTLEEVGHIFKLSRRQAQTVYDRAVKWLCQTIEKLLAADSKANVERLETVQVTSVIEDAAQLTPYLISHLKDRPSDLRNLPWAVFEHLIAEFFSSWGYEGVRIVGRNPRTGADIVAMRKPDSAGVKVRYFIEVKRWRNRVGVQVIDRVLGAILGEKHKHGYHLGMIVSLAGYSEMKKYTPSELTLLGIELRDGSHVNEWLREYRFNRKGLWLPNPYL